MDHPRIAEDDHAADEQSIYGTSGVDLRSVQTTQWTVNPVDFPPVYPSPRPISNHPGVPFGNRPPRGRIGYADQPLPQLLNQGYCNRFWKVDVSLRSGPSTRDLPITKGRCALSVLAFPVRSTTPIHASDNKLSAALLHADQLLDDPEVITNTNVAARSHTGNNFPLRRAKQLGCANRDHEFPGQDRLTPANSATRRFGRADLHAEGEAANVPSASHAIPALPRTRTGRPLTTVFDSRYMAEFNFGPTTARRTSPRDDRFGASSLRGRGLGHLPTSASSNRSERPFRLLKLRASYGLSGNDLHGPTASIHQHDRHEKFVEQRIQGLSWDLDPVIHEGILRAGTRAAPTAT